MFVKKVKVRGEPYAIRVAYSKSSGAFHPMASELNVLRETKTGWVKEAEVGVDLGEERETVGENMQEIAGQAIGLLQNGTKPEDFELDWSEAMTPRRSTG